MPDTWCQSENREEDRTALAQPVTLLPGSVRLDFGEGREILVGDVPGREDWGPVTLCRVCRVVGIV